MSGQRRAAALFADTAVLFTTSLCEAEASPRFLDLAATTIYPMDAVAILIGIVMFAVLLGLIYGIERI